MRNLESLEQQALLQWAELNKNKYPELDMMFAIPNGGLRNKITAARLKREGVRAGIPDICIPVARNEYYGLYIELKIKGNKPTENQKKWIEKLIDRGYRVEVCYGWEEAKNVICEYLGI